MRWVQDTYNGYKADIKIPTRGMRQVQDTYRRYEVGSRYGKQGYKVGMKPLEGKYKTRGTIQV